MPSKPVLRVDTVGPNALNASWEPLANIDGYLLFPVDPNTGNIGNPMKFDKGATGKALEGLVANTEYCYQLIGVNDEKRGPASDTTCARTSKPTPGRCRPSCA